MTREAEEVGGGEYVSAFGFNWELFVWAEISEPEPHNGSASAGVWSPPRRWLCPRGRCGGAGLLCPHHSLPPVLGETFGVCVGARIAGDLNARLQKSLLWQLKPLLCMAFLLALSIYC